MRYLAIDYGTKRTGLAVSDASGTMASPLKVITNKKLLVRAIIETIGQYEVDVIVVGLPLNMDGTEGPQSAKVRAFAEGLAEETDCEIVFYDERLSTFDAKQKLAPAEMSRKKRKKHLDSVAAAVFLQGYLDTIIKKG